MGKTYFVHLALSFRIGHRTSFEHSCSPLNQVFGKGIASLYPRDLADFAPWLITSRNTADSTKSHSFAFDDGLHDRGYARGLWA